MIFQLKINLDVLSLSLLLQIFLSANNGYLQMANGVTAQTTASSVIITSPDVNISSSTPDDVSSIGVTPSSVSDGISSTESNEISPTPTPDISSLSIEDISTPSDSLDPSNSITDDSSSDLPSSEYSITPSETAIVTEPSLTPSMDLSDMVTSTASEDLSTMVSDSNILDSSFYLSDSTDMLFSTAINSNTPNETSSLPDMFSQTSAIEDSTWLSMDPMSSSIDISPTQTITTDFVTSMINENSTHITNNLREATTSKTLTQKSSESNSSKIAAGVCIPLAILAGLGVTFYFYRRRRHQDRSVKFTDGGSTWSYANASFTDDAMKTGAQQHNQ